MYLEEATEQYENFHLAFLLQLASYLGFGPESAKEFENQLRERSLPFLADDMMNDALNTFMSQPIGTSVRLNRASALIFSTPSWPITASISIPSAR